MFRTFSFTLHLISCICSLNKIQYLRKLSTILQLMEIALYDCELVDFVNTQNISQEICKFFYAESYCNCGMVHFTSTGVQKVYGKPSVT